MLKSDVLNYKNKMSLGVKTGCALCAVAASVALPQALHLLGRMSGLGTALGEVFLPMHLPVILVGLLAGRYAGFAAGVFAPLLSYLITGMPLIGMLPFMMIELGVYGLIAGCLSDVRINTIAKVLIVQVAGRAVRAVAILAAVNLFGYTKIKSSVIINSIKVGIFGIIMQLIIIPLVVFWVETKIKESGEKNNE